MHAPQPFDACEMMHALRVFGVDVTAVTTAVLSTTFQSVALEWKQLRAPRALPPPVVHADPPHLECTFCKNTDARLFVHIYEAGDVVCRKCARVTVSNCLFEGEASRAFASDSGDEPVSNIQASMPDARAFLFSDEHALRTVRVHGDAEDAVKLMYTSDACLLRGQTTTWCKDMDKQQCVTLMEHAALKMGVCRAAREDAIALFARLRDTRQRVPHKRIAMAACMLVCHAAAQWSRAFAKATVTEHAYTFTCTSCGHDFHTQTARGKHACTAKPTRKRKVPELDMLSFV